MERALSSRTFRSGKVAKMTYSETDEPDATHHQCTVGVATVLPILPTALLTLLTQTGDRWPNQIRHVIRRKWTGFVSRFTYMYARTERWAR